VKVVWSRVAREDRAIFAYIQDYDGRAAAALDLRFARRIAQLAERPLICRPGRVAATRELVVHPNYVVIYDIAGETVRILRILHAARQWPLAPSA
jgi:plasmid stabilization system protein ParE